MKISEFIKSEKECYEFLSQFDIHNEVFDRVMKYAKFFSDGNSVYRVRMQRDWGMPELVVYGNSRQKYILTFLLKDKVSMDFSDGFLDFEKLEYDSKRRYSNTIKGYMSHNNEDKLVFILNIWAWE